MPYEEKRRAPRYETRAEAVVALSAQNRLGCTILDINDFGARLEFETGEPPDTFYLIEVKNAVAYRARTVWRRAPLFGTRFVETWLLDTLGAPVWLKELRGEAVRHSARARGIELVWSADN